MEEGINRVEIIAGKGQNVCYQNLICFPNNVFRKLLSQGCKNSSQCGKRDK